MSNTWFTADTHFGHGGALGLFKRPFVTVAEMDARLIETWNAVVAPQDTVWHLGDFGYRLKADRVNELLAALNGRKQLLVGNNDGDQTRTAGGWQSVASYCEIELEGTALVLCHYPFKSWNGMRKGAWNLHGHSHGALRPSPRQADVGVDVWGFRPICLAELVSGPSRRPSCSASAER